MDFLFRRGPPHGSGWRERFGRGLFLAGAGALILFAALENTRHGARVDGRPGAVPVTLTLQTVQPMTRGEVARHIEVVFITQKGARREFAEYNQQEGDRWIWQFRNLVAGIEIDLSPGYEERLAAARLSVNGRDVPVTLSRPEAADVNGRKMLRRRLRLPESELRHSVFHPDAEYINWIGDRVAFTRMANFIALWGGMFGLFLFLARSRIAAPLLERALPVVTGMETVPERHRTNRGWLWAGLAIVAGTLAATQWRDPFYFTQDDNFSQFLPVIMAAGESLFAGMLFDYNPYQLLGAPTVEVGTYALTYPGTYLAFALARLAGNENLTLEVFCMGHLVAGYFATWWTARRWGARAALAAGLGVCFVLSGYALVVGRSWYYMVPVFVWLPLALAALYGVLFRERKIGNTILLGLSLGVLFHAGNAQMWLYVAGLVAALALAVWMCAGCPRRAFAHLWAAGFGGLAVIMPLFLPQFRFVSQSIREGGAGYKATDSLTSLLLPLPLDATDLNFGTAPDYLSELGPLLYSGPLLVPAGLLVAALAGASLWARKQKGTISPPALFGMAGGALLLLTFGFAGPLWFIHAALPVLEKFDHPLKVLPVALLPLGLAAVLAWERLQMPEGLRRRGAVLFATTAFGLMSWNAMRTREVALYHFADTPYPGVERPLTEPRQYEARLFPMAPMRSMLPGFTTSRNLNFAMLYGELSLWGYDPIIWAHPAFRSTLTRLIRDPLPLLREYGVGRVVVWQEKVDAHKRTYDLDRLRPWQADIAGLIRSDGVPFPDLSRASRIRAEVPVPGARPLAFLAGDSSRGWPVTVAGPRVSVAFGEGGWPGGKLVLAFLAYPHMKVHADGRPIPFRPDGFGRVVARVPKGARRVTLGHEVGWGPGLGLSGALFAVAACGLWYLGGRGRAGWKCHE